MISLGFTPKSDKTWATVAEKPHIGNTGVPFINRHTSLLPSYKGIYPIFWCMLNDEKFVGVTVHTMTSKIDEGTILTQQKIPKKKQNTFCGMF